jgi:hypothetical protein
VVAIFLVTAMFSGPVPACRVLCACAQAELLCARSRSEGVWPAVWYQLGAARSYNADEN